MKNTYAVMMLTLGGIMLYSGYQGWSIADTVRFFTGQPLKDASVLVGKPGDMGLYNEDGTPKDLSKEPKTTEPKVPSTPGPIVPNSNGDKELNPNSGMF